MMLITKEQVLQALSNVQEPDLGKDLVTLNMIKDIVIKGEELFFTVVLTTPACPLKDHIKNACTNAIHLLVDKNIKVNVSFTSRQQELNNTPSNTSGIKNIIAVFSGKGGVGKSTVAANLALSLQQQGAKVGLMDADIYGPSVPIMFGLVNQKPLMTTIDGKNKIVPIEKYGIHLISIGFLIDSSEAIVWRGPMASSAIRQFITDVHWPQLDYLIIDMPPGTSDIHLTLTQLLSLNGAVIVSTPQKVAIADAQKAIAMFAQAQLKVPILGVVENMSYFIPEDMPDKKYYIFGKDGGKKLADAYEVPFLGELPLIPAIVSNADAGTIALQIKDNPAIQSSFNQFSANAARALSMYQQGIERKNICSIINHDAHSS